MKTFLIYSGFERNQESLIYRTSNIKAAYVAARRALSPDMPTVTVRDALGGLRAEFHCRNERQGVFGREWDIIESITS